MFLMSEVRAPVPHRDVESQMEWWHICPVQSPHQRRRLDSTGNCRALHIPARRQSRRGFGSIAPRLGPRGCRIVSFKFSIFFLAEWARRSGFVQADAGLNKKCRSRRQRATLSSTLLLYIDLSFLFFLSLLYYTDSIETLSNTSLLTLLIMFYGCGRQSYWSGQINLVLVSLMKLYII